ncbi:MAG: TIR domain-containing protein [Proteobacteria bacterium]|nr:TIR domain-containing protein [Pseudomonadota bacterium]
MAAGSKAVFLSYASEDTDAAQRIADALRAAAIEVWFDRSELRGGDAWDQTIRQRIRECCLFVPIISANSEARLEGYFRREWKLACDRMDDMASRVAFLVPVVLDLTPVASAEVPERFRQVQWTPLTAGTSPAALVERIAALLHPPGAPLISPSNSPSSTAEPLAGAAPATSQRAAPARGHRSAIAVGSVLVVLVAAWFAWKYAPASATRIAAATQVSGKSIAVLPFADLSERHDQGYFADGISEEIINLLARIPDLKVIGRTSSFQFRDRSEDLRHIGSTLGVAYLVEGSVRRSGSHVRTSVQLIDARDGVPQWSETYDREGNDALLVQDEITASLVRALQLEVTATRAGDSEVSRGHGEAHDAYLRGLHAFNRFDESGFEEAAADFRRAIELDPKFLAAAEQLARTYCDQPSWGYVPPVIGYPKAREAAEQVLRLDPDSPVGHTVLACVHLWFDWDWAAAERESALATRKAPRDAFTLVMASSEREAVGKWSQAVQFCEAAKAVDPLTAPIFQNLSHIYLRWGRRADAESNARRVLQISPTYGSGHLDLARVLLLEGKTEEALAELQREPVEVFRLSGLALAYHAAHRDSDARAALDRLVAEYADQAAVPIAEVYAYSGRRDEAIRWLERAYDTKDFGIWEIKSDPFLASLESDGRYKAFLRKLHMPE